MNKFQCHQCGRVYTFTKLPDLLPACAGCGCGDFDEVVPKPAGERYSGAVDECARKAYRLTYTDREGEEVHIPCSEVKFDYRPYIRIEEQKFTFGPFEYNTGSVKMHGVNIREITLDQLHREFARWASHPDLPYPLRGAIEEELITRTYWGEINA